MILYSIVSEKEEQQMNEHTTETLNDLIQRGVAIREQRIAEERARITVFYERLAHESAEREREIRTLLPPPLNELSKVDTGVNHAYVRIKEPFPGKGMVRIYVSRKDGQWRFIEYEAYNPDGYYLKLPTLEEALAYAAGVLEI
jgi:hypothetical protein